MSTSDRISVFLLEDTPAWQQAFDALISQSERYEVCAVTADYQQAVEAFEDLKAKSSLPDLVILDFCIPQTERYGDKSGVDAGYFLLAQGLKAEQMIIVSSSPPSEIGIPPYGNVPFAYLPKHQAASNLVQRLDEMMIIANIYPT